MWFCAEMFIRSELAPIPTFRIARIGMGAVVLNGAWIGPDCIIAAGTLIPEKTVVEAGSLWMGSPGEFRRKLEEKDRAAIMRYAANYLAYKDAYLAERK